MNRAVRGKRIANENTMSGEEIITTTAKVWLDDDGIVRAIMHPGAVDTLETATENIDAGIQTAGGVKRPLLLDISAIKTMNKEARDYYAKGDEREGCESAVGLIINSKISRIIGNFFLGLNRSQTETRLFNSQESAIEWLKEFL